MACHLGLRLVAEAVLAHGWGTPVDCLRAAEEYFHGAGVPANRLHLSIRTVEKHVAQLIATTGHPDRIALGEFASHALPGG
jgi:hypothetical protein